jgi:hypothetical protein
MKRLEGDACRAENIKFDTIWTPKWAKCYCHIDSSQQRSNEIFLGCNKSWRSLTVCSKVLLKVHLDLIPSIKPTKAEYYLKTKVTKMVASTLNRPPMGLTKKRKFELLILLSATVCIKSV